MRHPLVLAVLALLCTLAALAQGAPPKVRESPALSSVEILSDTKGVNFGPYLSDVVKNVRGMWYMLMPEVARAPLMKQGKVRIEFAIAKDGDLKDMKFVESSSDISMDRAAWGAITGCKPFHPLPSEFEGEELKIRLNFYYNPPRPKTAANTRPAPEPERKAAQDAQPAPRPKQ